MQYLINGHAYHLSVLVRFVLYWAVGTAGVVVVYSVIESRRFDHERDKQRVAESVRLELGAKRLARDLRKVVADLKRLTDSPTVQDYVAVADRRNRVRLGQELLNLVTHAAIYDQIRFIDKRGKEQLRANYNDGIPQLVDDAQLQDKSNRYYFREAIGLGKGQVYISPLDLNVENDRIEHPHKPVIRVAAPLYAPDNDEPAGILVLNFLAARIIADYEEFMSGSWGEALMVNERGYWLQSSDPDEEWGFMWSNGPSFAERYPQAWSTIASSASGTIHTSEGFFLYNSLRPDSAAGPGVFANEYTDQTWKIISRVSPDAWSFSVWHKLRESPDPLVGLAFIAAAASFLFAGLRTNNILKARALQSSERALAEAQSLAHIGNWVWDIRSGRLAWSDEIYRIFGRVAGAFTATYDDFRKAVHEEDRERVRRTVENAIRDKTPYRIEHRIVLPDGSVRKVQERGTIQLDPAGETALMFGTLQDITETARIAQALESSEIRYRSLFQQASDGIFIADTEGRYTDVNEAGCRMLGFAHEDIVGMRIHDFIPSGDVERLESTLVQLLRGHTHVGEWTLRHKDGYQVPVEVSAKILPDGRWQGFVRDISERKRSQEQLQQAAIVFDSTMEAILITDSNRRIIACNKAFTDITGFVAAEVVGELPQIYRSDYHDKEFYRELWMSLEQRGQWQGEIWNRRRDGTPFPGWVNISMVRDGQGAVKNYISVMSDISPLKDAEAQLAHLAHHDILTGLSNRLVFTSSLEHALEQARRQRENVALLFLDLDRFKLINDTFGHEAGDQLLKVVAKRLTANVRKGDLVARLGGDEFTIILEAVSHAEDAALLAKKLIGAVAKPIRLSTGEVVTSVSVGIGMFPDDATDAADLARTADAAMYRAKANGRNTYEFYTADLTTQAEKRLSTEHDLRRALERGEFILHYQPQIDIESGQISGLEALVRWRHPALGLRQPGHFIRVAEESGLIDQIGGWVLEEACLQVRKWRDAGFTSLRVAINLSGRQILHDNLVEKIRRALADSGLEPRNTPIQLEITENVLVADESIAKTLLQLRKLGISIAIDDFGTGYSSLTHIKHLPIDTLKIDKSFLADIPLDSDNGAITAATILMGHSLGLRIIAEGVETPKQMDFLKQQGCDQAQGYLIGKAVPAEQVTTLLQRGAQWPSRLAGATPSLQPPKPR